jgi:hypothetical protein
MSILAVDPTAPWYVKAGADALLYTHIGGGALGMLSGTMALAARKGSKLHSRMGKVFFAAMLAMAGVGAAVSPFLTPTNVPNVIAGIMTLYLLLTSWMTIRRKDGLVGPGEYAGLAVAIGVCVAGGIAIAIARNSPGGTIGDTPPQAFYVFLLVGSICAVCDLKVILSGGISGVPRIARHLWRMCVALTVATGSFFLGQQKMLPVALHGSAILFIPVIAPLVLMAYWLIRIRLPCRLRFAMAAAEPNAQ